MFVHAGASLHGHELKRDSSPPKGNSPHHQQPRNSSLLRSALRPLGDTNSSSHTTNNNSKHASFSLNLPSPEDFSSGRRSFTDPTLGYSDSTIASPSDLPPISPLALPSPTILPPQSRRPVSDLVSKRDLAVRFREPTPTMALRASAAPSVSTLTSDDEESLVGSDVGSEYTTNSSTRRRRRKPSSKQATRYAFARPAPQLKTQQRALIQFRPRMLLQVQRIEPKRPIPAFDILPSSTVSTSFLVPRLAKSFPRVFRAKPELGPDDLVIVKSEDYKSGAPAHKHHGRIEDRDLMGVVSPLPDFGDNAAEIIMADGSVWATRALAKGGYEFNSIDRLGVARTARWAKKNLPASRRTSDIPTSPSSASTTDRWVFSIVDPSSKRHPIMGALDSEDLAVYDNYTSLSASAGRFPPTKPFSNRELNNSAPSTPTKGERETHTTPEEYKRLMIVTASWIKLRLNGWPNSANPTFRRNSMHCRSPSGASVAERRRTYPFANNTDHTSPLQSPRPSFGTSRVSDERPQARAQEPTQPEVPKRHMSTGAAYMRRRRMETESLEEEQARKENLRLGKDHLGDDQIIKTKGLGGEEERTVTCRIKMRRLTQKLFHRGEKMR